MKRFENFMYLMYVLFLVYIIGLLLFKPSKPRIIESIQTEEEVEYEEFLDSFIQEEMKKEQEYDQAVSYVEKTGSKTISVTITKYNPEKSQCDEDPLITADNSKIDLEKLQSGELRWIAVSRDLREHFPYGSKVVIHSNDPEIRGIWEVHDTMNERWTERIDLLRPSGETKGKWEEVKISLLKS